MISDQWRLLSEMGECARDHEVRAPPAISDLSIQAADATLPRAEPALFEELLKEANPLSEFTFFIQPNIGRGKGH